MGQDSADTATAAAPIAGRYHVLRTLGRGGMGEVLEVRDETSDQTLALKRLLDPGRRSRLLHLFQREYHTLARLRHPAIVRVHDFGMADGSAYYTMELLGGEDLRKHCPLPWQKACPLLREVAGALSLLHARHLLYRDLNTKNVRVTADGHAKLMDFGALTHFGVPRDVVGTPPMIPPEAMGDAPLDQRADLFSLGALAYYALSGSFAFPARTIEQLRLVWAGRPAPLHELVEVPEELDRLVMALLSVHPQGRPQSAAEVIERLEAAAGLAPERELQSARRNLPRPALVGRDDTLGALTTALSATADAGAGSAIVLLGGDGAGKTRLLTECAIEAQLLGLLVAQVAIREHAADDDLLRRLLAAVQLQAPALVTQVLGDGGAALRPYLPAPHDLADDERDTLPPPLDSVERRARVMDALRDFLLALGQQRGLCLLFDDAHLAGPDDVGLLAMLADASAEQSMVSVAAMQRGAPAQATLERFSRTLELGPLGARGVEALSRSVFGDVPGCAMLSRWLYDVTGGNPAQCVSMLRHLVDARIVGYLGGTWVLPQALDERALPADAAELVRAQLAQLSDRERALASALALCRGGLSLELCDALADGAEEASAALDALSRAGVLISAGEGYTIRTDLIRSALRGAIDAPGRAALHRRIADVLLDAPGDDPAQRLEAAHHLIEGGDPLTGAEMLVAEGLDFADREGRLRGAIGDMEAALAAYRQAGRGAEDCIALLLPLMVAGMYNDRQLVRRHGRATLDALLELTGLATGSPRQVAASPFLVPLLLCATTLVSVAQACQDPPAARAALATIAPLGRYPGRSAPRSVHDFCVALIYMACGEPAAAERGMSAMLRQLEDERREPTVPEHVLIAFRGGLCNGIGMLLAAEAHPQATQYAERLQTLGHPRYEVYARQVLSLHHAYRGETRLSLRHQRRADLLSLQGAGSWRAQVWMPSLRILAQQMCADVVALKRTVQQLEALSEEIPTLASTRDLARMAHHLALGQAAQALQLFEARAADFEPGASARWGHAAANRAMALSALSRHAEALQVCDAALARLHVPEGAVATRVWLECQRGLAEHALGEPDGARDRLERLLHAQSLSDNPLIVGQLHHVLAQLSIRRRDPMRYEHHRQAVQRHFESTDNPALMLRYEGLVRESAALSRRTARR